MSEQEAVRRLVKSGPELWTQCSDPLLLSRHLRAFGEITITQLEPESTVAWEGESASGTVELEASGWGTRVRLTVCPQQPAAPASEPDHEVASAGVEPAGDVGPEIPTTLRLEPPPTAQPRRLGAWISSFLTRRREPAVAPVAPSAVAVAPGHTVRAPELEPEPTRPVTSGPAPSAAEAVCSVNSAVTAAADASADQTGASDLLSELEAALDSLGQAHHRPFSRA